MENGKIFPITFAEFPIEQKNELKHKERKVIIKSMRPLDEWYSLFNEEAVKNSMFYKK